ncbi:ABC transporter permease [Thermopolyspora sp. NPDC052614]|uniref:ABC transporter permease n=1 Tax=Thermopolyspora sp. NPDC052614 TaxID=3155682 RepID=UPI00343C78E4
MNDTRTISPSPSPQAAPARARPGRSPLVTLTLVEARLLLRDPAALFFPLVLPTALLLILGSTIPYFRKPSAELGGLRVIDAYFPASMTMMAVAVIALTIMPAALAGYRENGMLRRMSTTPVGPTRLLAAHMIVCLGLVISSIAVMVVSGRVVLGTAIPRQFPGFLLACVLGTAAFLALGLLIAVLAPSGKAAPGIGSVVMFPMLFLGGVWMPRPSMPHALGVASDLSPAGAFAEAMRLTWGGSGPTVGSLVVLVAWFVVAGVLAVRMFRWE